MARPDSPHTSRPVRVLHLNHSSEPGGAELALSRLLANPQWEAILVLPGRTGDGPGAFSELTLQARILRLGPRLPPGGGADNPLSLSAAALQGLRIVHTVLRLATSRAVRQADIIHANSTRAAAYGSLLSMLLRKPFVVHLRDRVDRQSMGGSAYATMTRIALPRATSVIANSHATADTAAPYLSGSNRPVVIYSPVGIVAKDALPQRSPTNRLTFGILGRLTPWKGQEMAIRAFAAAFPHDAHILEIAGAPLFGEEDYLDHLKATADELGLGNRVRFLGHVSAPLSLLTQWDVGLHASMRAEPMGQVLFQYMASGCAIVAPAEGGPAEILVDGSDALLFVPRDFDSMAQAMERMAASELRTTLAKQALMNPRLLTDTEVVSSHAEVFRQAAKGH